MSTEEHPSEFIDDEIIRYYDLGKEATRLTGGIGLLEKARTEELLRRFLPASPAVIVDVGGGPGTYACWLAGNGYDVHLVDAVALHVEQARLASLKQAQSPLASCRVGDARQLEFADSSVDGVLLLGPLYHLIEKSDRHRALQECRRILKPAGMLVAVAISRYASLHVGLVRGWIADHDFRGMVGRELTDGRHFPARGRPDLFTTAYFHHPEELEREIRQAGFEVQATLAVEGAGWLVPDIDDRWQVADEREAILTAVRWTESEYTVMGMSPHIMAVARRSH